MSPWTHRLPPGSPGSISAPRLQPYSATANPAKARRLAAGHFRDGSIRVAYQSAGTAGPREAQLLRQELIALGFDQTRIDMVGFADLDLYTAAGARGFPFDLVIGVGFCAEWEDPAWILDMSVNPSLAGAENNFGGGQYAVNSPFYRARLASISRRLKGAARQRALGKLDLEISRKLAPAVPLDASSYDYFFSSRVNPKSLAYTLFGWSFPALGLK